MQRLAGPAKPGAEQLREWHAAGQVLPQLVLLSRGSPGLIRQLLRAWVLRRSLPSASGTARRDAVRLASEVRAMSRLAAGL